MARTFVMGDIHGAHRALVQCFQKAQFDYDSDRLIFLGDVADGWPDTKACIEELLRIKNLVYVFGNHDFWALEWMQSGFAEDIWLDQGGRATIKSYGSAIPKSHINLLERSVNFYELENRLFVHAGFDPQIPIEEQGMNLLLWDRNLARIALDLHSKGLAKKLTTYDEVYIGHTPVSGGVPVLACEVWLMDTGAGWTGTLSMMDIDTKELFISEAVPSLYPGVSGRRRF